MEQIIGRKKEIELLTEYYHSGKAEFVAVYGRRRIGKTYLVRISSVISLPLICLGL